MVFMPQQSLVLVNKSEVLPKSLDKTAAGRQGEQAPVLGRGEHEPNLQSTCIHGNIIYPAPHIPTSKFGCPTLQQELYLAQLLSLNFMEKPSLNLTNVEKQSWPVVFKPLLL